MQINDAFKAFAATSKDPKLPSGSTLPANVIAHRIEVLTAFMASATPLNRLPYFKNLLESGGILTSPSHLG